MGKLDIVIPLGSGSVNNNSEIILALRSIEQYVPQVGNIYIAGAQIPEALHNIKLLQATDWFAHNKDANLFSKILIAALNPEISDPFIFWSDDQIALRTLSLGDFNVWNPRGPESFTDSGRTWHRRMQATFQHLSSKGINLSYNWDSHTPHTHYKADVISTLSSVDYGSSPGFCLDTLLLGSAKREKGDIQTSAKLTAEAQTPSTGWDFSSKPYRFLGYNDTAFNSGLKEALYTRFSESSRWETEERLSSQTPTIQSIEDQAKHLLDKPTPQARSLLFTAPIVLFSVIDDTTKRFEEVVKCMKSQTKTPVRWYLCDAATTPISQDMIQQIPCRTTYVRLDSQTTSIAVAGLQALLTEFEQDETNFISYIDPNTWYPDTYLENVFNNLAKHELAGATYRRAYNVERSLHYTAICQKACPLGLTSWRSSLNTRIYSAAVSQLDKDLATRIWECDVASATKTHFENNASPVAFVPLRFDNNEWLLSGVPALQDVGGTCLHDWLGDSDSNYSSKVQSAPVITSSETSDMPAPDEVPLTIITATGDRPVQFATVIECIKKQTKKPDMWYICDDGQTPVNTVLLDEIPCPVQYIRETPQPGENTLKRNFLTLLGAIKDKPGVIGVIEDDDYYPKHYLAHICELLQQYSLVGSLHVRNFNLAIPAANVKRHKGICCLHNTSWKAEVLDQITTAAAGDYGQTYCIDGRIWQAGILNSIRAKLGPVDTPVSLKAWPVGRGGTTKDHYIMRRGYVNDPECKNLRDWMQDDFTRYEPFLFGKVDIVKLVSSLELYPGSVSRYLREVLNI